MGAIEGKGLNEPKRLPTKSKKAGVELDPQTLTRRERDIAALDAVCAARPLKPPPGKRHHQ